MARGKAFCPYCYRVVPAGQTCPCRNRDAARKVGEPWRANYRDPEYLRNRQKVIELQHGRCKDCGSTCAHFDSSTGKWVTAPYGGEVDHERPLCDGGTNDPSNLTLRCKRCHSRADAERRKRRSKRTR